MNDGVSRSWKVHKGVLFQWLMRWVGLLCLALAVSGPVWSQPAESKAKKPSIERVLFVSDEWHDLTRKDGSGLYFDLVRAVYERQGVKVEFKTYPYARAVQIVRDRKADGWVASFMKEKDFALYPKWHFDKNEQMVIFRKDRGENTYRDLTSLRNQRVAWLRDFGLDRYIQEPMRITELDSIQSGLQMLERQRIDYFVGAKSDIEDYLAQSKPDMSNLQIKYAMHLGLYMAFADTPRGAALRDMWDAQMAQLHRAESFKAIYREYAYPYPYPFP